MHIPRRRKSLLLLFFYVIVFYAVKDYIWGTLWGVVQLFRAEAERRRTVELVVKPLILRRNVTKRELVLLQMVFRHGHRAPFTLYPKDIHDESFWKEGLGMLTQLGRLQHFVVGDHMQKRYEDFITTDPKEVELLNSDSARCQYGAYAFAAGLYRPKYEHAFTTDIKWQPIISRSRSPTSSSRHSRSVLTRGHCPIVKLEEAACKTSLEAKDCRHKYQHLYDFWTEHSGRKIVDWLRAADLGKTIFCESNYNLSVPQWGQKYWKELEQQAGLAYFWNFRTRFIQRYRVGSLLGYMLDVIRDKTQGLIPEKKVFLYSSHGSNVACLLLALGAYNMLAPPHASTLVLELWREDAAEYAIRFLYFNSSEPEKHMDPPVILEVEGCGEPFCPLIRFEEITRDLIPDDRVKECLDPSMRKKFTFPTYVPDSSSGRNEVTLTVVVFAFALLFCI